jgi:hypothetical protein
MVCYAQEEPGLLSFMHMSTMIFDEIEDTNLKTRTKLGLMMGAT